MGLARAVRAAAPVESEGLKSIRFMTEWLLDQRQDYCSSKHVLPTAKHQVNDAHYRWLAVSDIRDEYKMVRLFRTISVRNRFVD